MTETQRIVSGMRPTGKLHLGHYYGVLKNWKRLQHKYDCYFFVADWHALTTQYEDPRIIRQSTWETIIDWLAVGIDPNQATLFVQSFIPAHAELHLLLSMCTPLSWLERVPSFKDQQLKLNSKDLATYGFLGYPLMQAADILIYKAAVVPVGEDQVPHIELCREIARRFNHIFGKEHNFHELIEEALVKTGKKNKKLIKQLQRNFQEQGDLTSLEKARALISNQHNINAAEKERLLGYLEGSGRLILTEPEAKLTAAAKVPGLDGEKMSKSYGNSIGLREEPEAIDAKIKLMKTDPARVRRNDPGNPEVCPVFSLHKIASPTETINWASTGCKRASIGCIDCKQNLAKHIIDELTPIREKALEFSNNLREVETIVKHGTEKAQIVAHETIAEVREAMGLINN